MKKPIVLVLSTLMLGISATAMADSGHRWNNDHGKTMIDMSIVMTAVMIIVMITERQFGQMLIVVSIMVTMLLLNVVNVFLPNIAIAVIMFRTGERTVYTRHHVDTTGLKP